MSRVIELDTQRLRLRRWQQRDRVPFAAMNADAEVMRFFPAPMAPDESDAAIDRWNAQLAERGWSNWALERRDDGAFLGFVGLTMPRWPLPFAPCVEIGWRLRQDAWGQGFATEAATACLRLGFERLGLDEIVSFTALPNRRSIAVMERLGLRDAQADFDHPAVPAGHALRRHCLHRMTREAFLAQANAGAGVRS